MYYDQEHDLKRLGEMKALAPEDFTAWVNLDKIVSRQDGKVPRKYRELIAVAVAHTTQCPYCIEVHTKAAKKAASRQAAKKAAPKKKDKSGKKNKKDKKGKKGKKGKKK